MRPILRPLAGLLLALVLSVTAQSMAVARGGAPSTGVMVLCIAGTVQRVLVDDSGAPAAPRHICPDCALSLLLAVAETPPAALGRIWTRQAPARVLRQMAKGRRRAARLARGPPVPV